MAPPDSARARRDDPGRPDPDALLAHARKEGRGRTLEEFDLDAALARRPQLLPFDELARTNAPGSHRPKRWTDADELRAAGTEVWATRGSSPRSSARPAAARRL